MERLVSLLILRIMIKRPLNERFSAAVLDGRKITTIRQKPWPIGVPIMLYNWSGAAYRSPQIDVTVIIVTNVEPIEIDMPEFGEPAYYPRKLNCGCPLWISEGFDSQDSMDSWFYNVVKKGQKATKSLMKFHLANV